MPTLDNALESLGLTNLVEVFRKEQIDFDSLVCSAAVISFIILLCSVDVF